MSENENYENEFENENSIEKEEKIPVEDELLNMGFDEILVQKACKYNDNNIEKCLFWIYYHLDKENLDEESDSNRYNGFVNKFAKNINNKMEEKDKEEEEIKKLEEEEKNNESFNDLKNKVINDVNNENNNENKENNNENNENKENNNENNENNNENNNKNNENNENNESEKKNNNNEIKEEIEESNKLNDSAELEKEINEMSKSNNNIKSQDKNKTNRTIDSSMYISNNEMSNNNNINNENSNEKIENSTENIENSNENKKSYTHIENINLYISILKKILKVSVNKNILLKIFKTIKKIIENILTFPDDDKYKSIKKNNEKFHENIGQYNSALKILEEIGFNENEENILKITNIDTNLLKNTQTILENEIENLNEI